MRWRRHAPADPPSRAVPSTTSSTTAILARPGMRVLGLIGAIAALGLVCIASLAFGSKPIPFSTVIESLTSYDDDVTDHLIIRELRVPRTLVGLAVGMALGFAGALMQGVTRNPLADPGILGVNAGAALGVVMGIYLLDVSSLSQYVWLAFVGAAAASVVVYGLGSAGRGGATPVKLALAGAAVAAVLTSLTSGVLLLDVDTLDQFRFWVVGSLAGRGTEILLDALPFMIVGGLLALASGRALNTLSMGDDVARSLGTRVAWSRALAALSVVLLAGAAVAVAGPIAFVGLTVPHVARAFVGPDYRWLLPYSAVLAGILLVGADTIGRIVIRPSELQVGIVTALVGAPFFILLVRRRKLAAL